MGRLYATAAFAVFLGASSASAATLDDIAAAMGSARLDTLQVSGTGRYFIVGQQVQALGDYPEAKVPRYARIEDYGNGAISLDYALLQDGSMLSAGGLAFGVENPRKSGLKGDQAWSFAGPAANAAPNVVASLQHELWTSPHGIVKAALADKAAVQGSSFEISRPGKFKARATVNAANLVEMVESWVDSPVLGDMAVVTRYADYEDFGGVMVPTRLSQTTGGHPSFELAFAEVKTNPGPVAPAAQINPPNPPQVKIDKAADGVWFASGGSHNSAVIEFGNGLMVVEGPLGDGRAGAVIDAVRKEMPGKPIVGLIVTHHHFDHSGGVRAFAAEGIPLIVAESAKSFYEKAYAAPRTIAPDRMARAGKTATFRTVADKLVLTPDGGAAGPTPAIELYEQQGNTHVEGMVFVYLPKQKVLIEADAFSGPREPVTKPAERPSAFTVNLWDNLKRRNLEVETVLPIHGRMAKGDELKMAAGQAP